MLAKQFIKKALLSAFFYCCPINKISAHERILKDIAPNVKTFIVLNYYDLKREVNSYSPNKLDEVLLELNGGECYPFDKDHFLAQFSETNDPIEAVRLIEEIEVLCSK